MTITEYLANNNLISKDQIEEAKERLLAQGGSLEDHLFLIGAANESTLLAAMQECHGWTCVELADREIPPDLIQVIPAHIAWRLKVIPIAREIESNSVVLACKDPSDVEAHSEIEQLLGNCHVAFFAAVGVLIDNSIIKHYRSDALRQNKDEADLQISKSEEHIEADDFDSDKKSVYIISPDWQVEQYIGNILVEQGYTVVLANEPWEVIDDFKRRQPDLVLVREAAYDHERMSISRLLKLIPDSTVQHYQSSAELLDISHVSEKKFVFTGEDLGKATLAFSECLGKSRRMKGNGGQLLDRLCRRMGLSPKSRLATITAWFLHNMSELYFDADHPADRETAFDLLISLAGNDGVYPPAALKIIRLVYPNLSTMAPADVQSIDFRNSNIVTLIDYYQKHFQNIESPTEAQFERIEQHLRTQVGSLLLPNVTEAFLDLLRDDIVKPSDDNSSGRALIYNEFGDSSPSLSEAVTSCGITVTLSDDPDELIRSYQHAKPDFLIIALAGPAERVFGMAKKMSSDGINFSEMPTVLFHSPSETGLIAPLLSLGIYDVIPFNGTFEILRTKLMRICDEKEKASSQRLQVMQDLGTHGNLTHMNVIDLLQATGPSNKTLCINVSAKGKQLTMYLDKGQLIYAENDDLTGEQAIYKSLNWDSGIWSVDQVSQNDLPEKNISHPIDAILIEGCHLIDEIKRDESTSPATPTPTSTS